LQKSDRLELDTDVGQFSFWRGDAELYSGSYQNGASQYKNGILYMLYDMPLGAVAQIGLNDISQGILQKALAQEATAWYSFEEDEEADVESKGNMKWLLIGAAALLALMALKRKNNFVNCMKGFKGGK
jgi:hypothetical protein